MNRKPAPGDATPRPASTTSDLVGEHLLVALVVARTRAEPPAATAPQSSPTVPATATATAAAAAAFRQRGFAVAPREGPAFVIRAPSPRFEMLFDVHIAGTEGVSPSVRRGGRSFGSSLPLDRLPSALRKRLESVTLLDADVPLDASGSP